MTVTLELSLGEHASLEGRARTLGVPVEAVLRGLIASLPPLPDATETDDPEDPNDPEERAERDRERAEIEANVLRWRAERGV